MGRRPREYSAHARDDGSFVDAQELWEDYVKLTTHQADYTVPPSVRRIDAAQAPGVFPLPPVWREVISVLGTHGIVNRDADSRNSIKDEAVITLASLWRELNHGTATISTGTDFAA